MYKMHISIDIILFGGRDDSDASRMMEWDGWGIDRSDAQIARTQASTLLCERNRMFYVCSLNALFRIHLYVHF